MNKNIVSYLAGCLRKLESNLQSRMLAIFGLSCVLFYVLFKMTFPVFVNLPFTLAGVVSFWCLCIYRKAVNSRFLLVFVLFSAFIQTVSWGLSLSAYPEWAVSDFHIEYLTRFLAFIPIAWWAAQYKQGWWWIFASACSAILLSPWITGDGLQEIYKGLRGARIDLGIHNAQHTSLLFGFVFLLLACLLKLAFLKNKFFIFPISLGILYSLLIVYLSGSRQSWLALLITGLLFAVYFTFKRVRCSTGKQKILSVVVFLSLILGVVSALVNNDKIVKRVMSEKKALTAIASLDFDAVPYSSFGIRFHSWRATGAFIAEKPVFGWGADGRKNVIKHTKWLPKKIKRRFGHLHNTYLEILVNFGVVGFLFYLYMWFYFSRQVYRKMVSGGLEKEIGYFYFSFLCFWAVINCFESYQSYWTGTYILHVFLGGIFGRIWYLDISQAKGVLAELSTKESVSTNPSDYR